MLVALDGHGPRYAQIARALAALIHSGALEPGARVPPTRELARDLSCSRNVVLLAYEQLALEGYFTSRGGAGTFVSSDIPVHSLAETAARTAVLLHEPLPDPLSRQGRRVADAAAGAMAGYAGAGSAEIDFMYGLSEPDARMVSAIRVAFAATLRRAPYQYPHAAGDQLLREQVALRLRVGRGIVAPPSQLLITSGTQQAIEICTRLLVAEGDRVVVEDPTYDGVNSVVTAAGADIVRVPVDDHGMVVAALPEDGPPVRVVFVTPSHQFPTGGVMPAVRRYALLAWARRRGAHIFEDDYDSEFRFAGRPVEALAAIEPDGPVIYSGTFAKSLFPSLRLGYLSLPRSLVASAVGCKWLNDRGSPVILQRLVAELMVRGDYDRHVRRMLRRYRIRRDALIGALRRHLGEAAQVDGETAGLHLVLRLRGLAGELLDTVVDTCRDRGVGVYSLERGPAVHADRFPGTPPNIGRRAALLLGYGLLDVARIERGVEVLAAAYRDVIGNGGGVRGRRESGRRA